jgi:CRISPR-associated endoribonuclease Cas6/Csy4 subtype I-F
MNSHYLDYIIHLPDEERGETSHVLARLWQRIHGILSAQDLHTVGVSLPQMQQKFVGRCLRLHGSAQDLSRFHQNQGLRQLETLSPIQAMTIQATPERHQHCYFRRVRYPEKQTLSWMLRDEQRWLEHQAVHHRSIDPALLLQRRQTRLEKLQTMQQEQRKAADAVIYLRFYSRTTQRQFSLIVQQQIVPTAKQGLYSHYGLAQKSLEDKKMTTIPWF